MRQLSEKQNFVFRIGALLMAVGAVVFLFQQYVACVLFPLGAILFAAMQLQTSYAGNDLILIRLRKQQLLGSILFLLSAVAMVAQVFSHYNAIRFNEWVILLLIGSVIQFYTAIRIPQALKIIPLIVAIFFSFSSCVNQYVVDGMTTVHGMEGKMLYLKAFDQKDLRNIDSCYVTHGKFQFKGNTDSIIMANLFLGEQSLMPVVIENENIVLKIDEQTQMVSGSPLNDSLYNFIKAKNHIENQLAELPRLEGRMVMDGMDHDEVLMHLATKERMLNIQNDQLVTGFIKRNYSNVLGPGVFMIMTSTYAYPVLTPQIEELLLGAPSYFINHPYVNEYLRVARENMEKLQQQ